MGIPSKTLTCSLILPSAHNTLSNPAAKLVQNNARIGQVIVIIINHHKLYGPWLLRAAIRGHDPEGSITTEYV